MKAMMMVMMTAINPLACLSPSSPPAPTRGSPPSPTAGGQRGPQPAEQTTSLSLGQVPAPLARAAGLPPAPGGGHGGEEQLLLPKMPPLHPRVGVELGCSLPKPAPERKKKIYI